LLTVVEIRGFEFESGREERHLCPEDADVADQPSSFDKYFLASASAASLSRPGAFLVVVVDVVVDVVVVVIRPL